MYSGREGEKEDGDKKRGQFLARMFARKFMSGRRLQVHLRARRVVLCGRPGRELRVKRGVKPERGREGEGEGKGEGVGYSAHLLCFISFLHAVSFHFYLSPSSFNSTCFPSEARRRPIKRALH